MKIHISCFIPLHVCLCRDFGSIPPLYDTRGQVCITQSQPTIQILDSSVYIFLSFNREAAKYFTLSNVVFERVEEGEGFVYIYPKRTNLRSRLHIYSPPNTGEELTQDDLFVDFVTLMLQVDPLKRPTAAHALLHPWLNDVDSLDVTYTDN